MLLYLSGIVKRIKSDGYERYIELEISNTSVERIWCYFVETNEYLKMGEESTILSVGNKIDVRLTIEWVNVYNFISGSEATGFKQPINESSHIVVNAEVLKVLDEYTIICDIGTFKNILVEFEIKIPGIKVGHRISFSGNLKASI
jgi:hypothetical protein